MAFWLTRFKLQKHSKTRNSALITAETYETHNHSNSNFVYNLQTPGERCILAVEWCDNSQKQRIPHTENVDSKKWHVIF